MTFLYFLLFSYALVILARIDGPFDVVRKTRMVLINHTGSMGPFFYKLLECPYCLGFWTGLISYVVFFPLTWMILPFALISSVSIYLVENLSAHRSSL